MYTILNKPLWPFVFLILLVLAACYTILLFIIKAIWLSLTPSEINIIAIVIAVLFFCTSFGLIRWLWISFVNVPSTINRLYEWDDGPWLQWKDFPQTSIIINWITKSPTASYISWGSSPESLTKIGNPIITKIHRITLENLSPQTKYYYQIVSDFQGSLQSSLHSFITAPSNYSPFSFVLFGDTQNGGGWGDPQWGYPKLIDHIQNSNLQFDLILHVGDASDQGNDIKSWHQFLSQSARLAGDHPMHISVGNHDTGSNYLHDPTIKKTRDDGANFDYLFAYPYQVPKTEKTLTSFRGRYYAFEYSNALLLFLDTQNQQLAAPWSPQWKFVEETLVKTTKPWKLVFVHWPMIEIKQKNRESQDGAPTYFYRPIHYAKYFLPLFEKYGVQVIFTGHAHEFQHIEWSSAQFFPEKVTNFPKQQNRTIHQIISGGAGNEMRKNAALLPTTINLPGFHIWEDSTHYTFVRIENDKIMIEAHYPDGNILYGTQINLIQ